MAVGLERGATLSHRGQGWGGSSALRVLRSLPSTRPSPSFISPPDPPLFSLDGTVCLLFGYCHVPGPGHCQDTARPGSVALTLEGMPRAGETRTRVWLWLWGSALLGARFGAEPRGVALVPLFLTSTPNASDSVEYGGYVGAL